MHREANKRAKLLAVVVSLSIHEYIIWLPVDAISDFVNGAIQELTKLFDVVDDPPEIEAVNDEVIKKSVPLYHYSTVFDSHLSQVLLSAWRDKTLAELKEIEELEGMCRYESYFRFPNHFPGSRL